VSTQAALRSASLGSSSGKLAGFPGGKRSVSTASALSPLREAGASADEADVSGASPVGGQRMPLAPATGALNAALPLFGGINADTFNASVAVKKAFPRPSAGGPGPIRRRTRTSVAVAALGHPSLAAPAPAAAMARVPGQSGVGDRVKATRVVAPAMRASSSLFS
jgi:kinesin family protein 18/19